MPDQYLASIDMGEWKKRRRDRLSSPGDKEFSFVAEDHKRVVGWTVGGPERNGNKEYVGELYAIYLLEEYQRRGIGRRLTAEVAGRLVGADIGSMLMWVLADNTSARRFYEALGGQYVREQDITIGGVSLVEVAYGWKEITKLAQTKIMSLPDAGGPDTRCTR